MNLWQRLNALLLSVPVFGKVMGIALGMALLLGGGMLWQIHRTWQARMLARLEQRGVKFVQQVAAHCAELMAAGRESELAVELKRSMAEATDVVYVFLEDNQDTIVAQAV